MRSARQRAQLPDNSPTRSTWSGNAAAALNFGYFYDRSPIIAYDGEQAHTYTMGTFTSTTVPGCRVPHVWVEGRRSLYDAMGPDYTLLRLDPTSHVADIVTAAAQRGLPLAILDVRSREASQLYHHRLVLVRPDQHVAWRGDAEPADTLDLVDLVRGAARMSPDVRSYPQSVRNSDMPDGR